MSYASELGKPAILASARALLERDQYDDWLPDPVHFEDLGSRLGAADAIFARVAATSVSASQVLRTPLPRRSGTPLTAATPPVDARIQIHAATVRIARKIRAKLSRDRVAGFDWSPSNGFSEASAGLADLSLTLHASDVILRAGRARVVDVRAAWSSMSWDNLQTSLLQAGADLADLAVIRLAYGGGVGLPTADDAWAFLVNYYLAPVDRQLLKGPPPVDFYRVRDEYIVFSAAAAARVKQLLSQSGLMSTVKAVGQVRPADFRDGLDELCQGREDGASVGLNVMETDAFSIGAQATCEDERVNSDGFDYYYSHVRPLSAPDAAAAAAAAMAGAVDAVEMLPLLRPLWRARAPRVYDKAQAGPADGLTTALAARRQVLAGAAAAGPAGPRAWTAHIAAVLMSDLGALNASEANALLAQARSPGAIMGGAAARAALARSSTASAAQVLPADFPHSGQPIRRRWEGLSAYYLARRGVTQPFQRWSAACSQTEPQLANRFNAALVTKP